MSANRSGGRHGGSGKGARSVGAAAGSGHPNGAILDDSKEVADMRRQRFKAWASGRGKKSELLMAYDKSPKPGGGR